MSDEPATLTVTVDGLAVDYNYDGTHAQLAGMVATSTALLQPTIGEVTDREFAAALGRPMLIHATRTNTNPDGLTFEITFASSCPDATMLDALLHVANFASNLDVEQGRWNVGGDR